ncbi:cytochrome c [Phaeobacter sp. CAU 1743]|jgi:cytochrome c553|uniref:c-type cytochrome n=1 Tax=Rhodobacterales TaxID=204455 RepID=UPI0023B531E8
MSRLGSIITGVLAVGSGALVRQVMRPAPSQTGHSTTPPNTSGIAEGAPIFEVKLPENLASLGQMRKRASNTKCASCHGTNAAGREGKGPPLVHKIYKPSHHSDMAFVMAGKNGVRAHHWRFGTMPPVDGVTDTDMKAITAYVRALQKKNGIF